MALNDTRLRTLKPKPGKTERLIADDINGLYIRIRAGAKGDISRTWQFRRRERGKLSITTIGVYPQIPLIEARRQAIEMATKRSVYSPTIGEAVERWVREQVNPVHKKPELIHGYINRAILPAFGDRQVRDIRPAEIADAVRAYKTEVGATAKSRHGGVTAAKALLAVYKGLFDYCVASGWIEQSPAAQLKGKALAGPSPGARDRVLTDDEIRFVMTTDTVHGPVLRFLLATGLRIGEAYNGYREGQYWVVPAASSKNNSAHRVWLSELALAQLAYPWMPPHSVQCWLTNHVGTWTAHDLRRTFSTRINGMGVAPYVVEKLLNHTLPGVMGIYNRQEYLAERQQALEAWSAWLKGLVETPPADVVSLRQASQQAA
jgi:integrase